MGAVPEYMVSREDAWHGLATVKGRFLNSEELLEDPRINYAVEKHQLVSPFGGSLIPVWATYRMDVESPKFLKEVGKDYTIIHHSLGLKMPDDLIAADDSNKSYFETAGVMWEGRVFFSTV